MGNMQTKNPRHAYNHVSGWDNNEYTSLTSSPLYYACVIQEQALITPLHSMCSLAFNPVIRMAQRWN